MFVIIYLNNILVYWKNEKNYKKYIRQILNALKKANLRIVSKKSQFYQMKIKFLSYIITNYKIKINSKKIRVIIKWSRLKLVKETQLFLEFVNFYQKFIWNYSKVAAALTDIIKKEQEFFWNDKAQKTFEKLKQLFAEELILQMFDLRKQTVMKADALDQAQKSVLSQSDESENLYLIAFHSWKFTELELNYEIHNKKLLAIVKVFKQWKSYLEKSKDSVQVYINHKNLIYFIIIKILNWWQVYWLKELLNFNFEIYYWKESENIKTDVLSWRSDYMKNKS